MRIKNHIRSVVSCLAVVCMAAVAGAFPQKEGKPSDGNLPKSGAVHVRVAFPDEVPASGAVVTIGRQRFTADAKGVVALPGIPASPGVATAVTWRQEGGFLGFFRKNMRYGAFSASLPTAGAPLEMRLKLSPAPDLDAMCRSCHPEKGAGAARIIKCTHSSGVPLKPALADRVARFNRENEELHKAGKPYYPAIVLEQRKIRKGLFGEDRPFLTCESCHSNHVDTGERAYVLMPFAEKSILCRGCHV